MTDNFDEMYGRPAVPRQSFTDRLTQNRPRIEAAPPVPAASAHTEYRAFGIMPSTTVSDICTVRGWLRGTDVCEGVVFHYRFLMRVVFFGDDTLHIVLPDSVIVVEGRHLLEMSERLMRATVTFIQQYHPNYWPLPGADVPAVTRIEIVKPSSFQALR